MAESIDSKCRLCQTNNGRFCIPINENNPNNLSDKIFKCLGTRIEKSDTNRKICVECTVDINEVYNRLFPSKSIPDTESLSEKIIDESVHGFKATIAKPESIKIEEFGSNIDSTLKNVNAASTPKQVRVVKDPIDAKKNRGKTSKSNSCSALEFPQSLHLIDDSKCAVKCSSENCDMFFGDENAMSAHVKSYHAKPNKDPLSCPLCEGIFAYRSSLYRHIKKQHKTTLSKAKTAENEMKTAERALAEDCSEPETNVAETVSTPKRKASKVRKRIITLNRTVICGSVKRSRVHKQPRLRPTASARSGQQQNKSRIQSTAAASSPRASTSSLQIIPAENQVQKTIRAEVKAKTTTSPYHTLRKRPALRPKLVSKTFVSRWLDETEIPSNEDSVNPTNFPIVVHDSSLMSKSKSKKSKKSSRRSSATKGKYHRIESILTHKAGDAGNDLYLVHWMNHSASHDVWVPFKNFTKDIQTLIESKVQK